MTWPSLETGNIRISYFANREHLILIDISNIIMASNSLRKRVYNLLQSSHVHYSTSWWVDVSLITLITLNVIAFILESVPSLREAHGEFFIQFELVSVMIFSVEYFLRIWSASEEAGYQGIRGKIRKATSPMLIIDLLAILPFYLVFLPIDLRFLRMLRLFRLFRLFKVLRYVTALNFILTVLERKKEQLIISMVFALFMLMFVSSIMYYIEYECQPDDFSSIPQTMWWGVATLTTVGYGDVTPHTPLGRFLGGIISILGIGIFALPAGILASGCSEAFEQENKKEKVVICPHCEKGFKTTLDDD